MDGATRWRFVRINDTITRVHQRRQGLLYIVLFSALFKHLLKLLSIKDGHDRALRSVGATRFTSFGSFVMLEIPQFPFLLFIVLVRFGRRWR
jgi:hypothetical protein